MILITCKEAAVLSNKKQYREASVMERFKLRLHLTMCRICTVFDQKNRQLSLLLHRARLAGLKDSEKEEMKRALKDLGKSNEAH